MRLLRDGLLSVVLASALFAMAAAAPAFAGTLSCSITTAAACTGGTNTVILRMSAATNAHAELPSQSTSAYSSNVVCCSGVTGLGNSCSGTFATAAHLSAATNAQVEQNTFSNFAQNACISVSSGSVSIGYGTDCTAYDTTLASMPATSNSHVGSPADYTNKICGSGSLSSLTLTVSSNSFGTFTPGTAQFATTTVAVSTSNTSGWSTSLTSDDRTNGGNTTMDLDSDAAVGITDQAEWIPGLATSSAGTAVRISSLGNSADVLAFRVMTASSTNGTPFISSAWWGTTDSYADSATSLWAGIASSTSANAKIGNSSVQSGGTAINTVLYYIKVPVTQKNGAYTAPMTVTATANP